MDIQHEVLRSNTALRTGAAWRDAEAARVILGIGYEEFVNTVPRDERITVLAQYEIKWRVDAIAEWERAQESEARSKARERTKPKRGRF
jgi:hypothetical protein